MGMGTLDIEHKVRESETKQIVTAIIKIADIVAFRHFPESYGQNYPYVDRYGNPVAVIDTEMGDRYTQYSNKVYKKGRIPRDRPISETAREVYARPNEVILDVFSASSIELAQALLASALGVKVIRKDKFGNEVEVYDKPPDPKAADMILNRLMGKPMDFRISEETVYQETNVKIFIPDNGRDAANTLGATQNTRDATQSTLNGAHDPRNVYETELRADAVETPALDDGDTVDSIYVDPTFKDRSRTAKNNRVPDEQRFTMNIDEWPKPVASNSMKDTDPNAE